MTDRSWIVAEPAPAEFLAARPELPPLVAHVLWQRGLRTAAEVDAFLHQQYPDHLHDPFRYTAMRLAVDRILAAVERSEPMTVFGDYDADGVTATAIMIETLHALGGRVDWYLPERLAEGYGLNLTAVEHLAGRGTKLLIAVDCGATNVDEVSRAKELDLDVIILDHHQPPATVPPADVILNPSSRTETYPFHGHSSGGLAFKVATALLQATDNGRTLGRDLGPDWSKWLLDLVAISTVADLMPLRDENRVFVHFGLIVLRKTRRPGLRALFDFIGTDLSRADEYAIGFQVAPRLNAAGRLQHPSLALELLLTKDPIDARRLAAELQQVNTDRQRLTELAVAEALEQIEGQGEQRVYVAFAPHWSPGILGLVAGRLVERVWRPVIVMTENGDDVIGSGRSVPGFNIMDFMTAGHRHFRRFGGHPAACGFTLTSKAGRPDYEDWVRSYRDEQGDARRQPKPVFIDATAAIADFDPAALDALQRCGPFGAGNERPRFLLHRVRLDTVATAGSDGQHLRLIGTHGSDQAKFIGFRLGDRAAGLTPGQVVDVVVEASWNTWNGQQERQLKIVDVRPSDAS